MASHNFNKIMNVNKESLERDVGTFFELLQNLDPVNISDTKQLRKMFQVAQALMVIKNNQLDEVIKLTMEETKRDAKAELKLSAEINQLKRENLNLKYDSRKLKPSTSRILDDYQELEGQFYQITRENSQIERELVIEKETTEKYSKEIVQLSKEKVILRQEKNVVRQEFRDYMSQVQRQWEQLIDKMDDNLKEYKDNLSIKEQELKIAADETKCLNNIIRGQNTAKIHQGMELKAAQKKLGEITEYNTKLERTLQDEDIVNTKLKEESVLIKTENASLKKHEKSHCDTDDAILTAVNQKVEEWKNFMKSNEQEVAHYQYEIQILKRKLEAARGNAKPTSVTTLCKVAAEKEEIICDLTERVKDYTQLMNDNKMVITNLKNQLSKNNIEKKKTLWLSWEQQLLESERSAREAEDHALEKDRDLCKALKRPHQYENMYSLEDATNEIRKLEDQLKFNERKIENLIRILNSNKEKVNTLFDENEELRGKLVMKPERIMGNLRKDSKKLERKKK